MESAGVEPAFDPHRQALLRGDEPVPLTPKVFEMLTAFLERPGELLPKEELMERLWPDTFVEEANLAQNVAVLRKALGDNPKTPRYIATVAGRGYRFVADVRHAEKNGDGDQEAGRSEMRGHGGSPHPGVRSKPPRLQRRGESGGARRIATPNSLVNNRINSAMKA